MKLNDILPDFIGEINNNIKEYENYLNNSIIEVIKNEIKNEIEEYIYNIKINLIESITNKIIAIYVSYRKAILIPKHFFTSKEEEHEIENFIKEKYSKKTGFQHDAKEA